MVLETSIVSTFSFLTLTDSENSRLRDNTHFWLKFWIFGPQKGVKMGIFEKSLKSLLDSHINIIYANFKLSYPYRFRKVTFDRYYTFWLKFRTCGTLKGGKNGYFQKIVKNPVRWFHKHHVCLISPS